MASTLENFAVFFSPEIEKVIADFRASETGVAIRNEYIKQELQAIANNPIVWLIIIAAFIFAARR